jgi:preprotein translocase subunit SecG
MQVLNIFHVLIAIALIGFVLIQRGQGATAGAAFGSGASGTVFGARGAGNFLSRSTWVLAALFCAISLTMAVMVSHLMQTAKPDLGVVVPTEAVTEQQAPAEELTVGPGEPAVTDLPALEQAVEPAGQSADESAGGSAEGDLPAPEGEAANEAAEEQPAAEGGAVDDAGADAGGSPPPGDDR